MAARRRQQRPRGATSRDAVVTAALSIVDRVGVEALTIRAVAQAVGAPPMSLYRHFATKEELLDHMYAEISRLLYADLKQATWQGELMALCHQVRTILMAHPRWTPLLSRPVPPLAVALRERLLKLMIADGMSPRGAFIALSSAVLTSMGLVLVELTLRGPDGQSTVTKRFDRLKTFLETSPDTGHPVTKSAVAIVGRFDLNDTFSFAVRTLVAGLEASNRGTPA